MATICFYEFSFAKLAAASSMSAGKRQHRKGGNLMVQIHEQRTIAASPERVFDWLHDTANLTVSPVLRKAVWAKGSSGPGVGAVREVTGFGLRAILAGCDDPAPPPRRPPQAVRAPRVCALGQPGLRRALYDYARLL
jgi:hypothetical protein